MDVRAAAIMFDRIILIDFDENATMRGMVGPVPAKTPPHRPLQTSGRPGIPHQSRLRSPCPHSPRRTGVKLSWRSPAEKGRHTAFDDRPPVPILRREIGVEDLSGEGKSIPPKTYGNSIRYQFAGP